jgi:hypothetical protein
VGRVPADRHAAHRVPQATRRVSRGMVVMASLIVFHGVLNQPAVILALAQPMRGLELESIP